MSPKNVQRFWDNDMHESNDLQRRASFQTRKGRCSTLNCCMSLSFNRLRLKATCSSASARKSESIFGKHDA
ncbi:hypothetical protein FKV68_19670 [Sinorhizobium mexicanum]|uniref:Uncharacterized protein n=1 Tax=Sinorhizobium mexicanum TaxID=375549 RepID=A0A859QVD3_9HYPH|nr:hypothetical protein FKV68_19670 [Sinorhizobium mexicanum]